MKFRYSLLAAALAFPVTGLTADAMFVDSQTVKKVQKTLTDRGYRTGGIDGRMGPQTKAAVRNFQKSERLEPTGQLNSQTLVALGVQKSGDKAAAKDQRYEPATIRKVQQTLNARGFRAGVANGTLGETTQTALRAFQKSENLEPTGRLNDRTLAALGIAEDSASSGSTRGASAGGATIREVQRKLASRGYNPGAPDGVMGAATRKALMEFQRAENLAVTGQANRQTLAALGIGAGLAGTR